MMSQSAWAGLNVIDFFSSFNWSGMPPKLDPLEPSPESLNPSSWLVLSVTDFLAQANWRGKASSQRSDGETATPRALSVTLSVGEFFANSVWKSQREVAVASLRNVLSTPVSLPSPSQDISVNNLSNLF